jgi:hypothetical protein
MPHSPTTDRNTDRSYWLSRQWVYQSFMVPGRSTDNHAGISESPATKPMSSQSDSDEAALTIDLAVREILALGRIHTDQRFTYAGAQTPIRPMTRRLLGIMFSAGGRHVSITRAARELWGRTAPPSPNTLYIAVFRVNAALRATRCPLKLCVRLTDLCFERIDLK